ncbi:MAG: hypothetical protein QOE36_314 [Gaiellaceae bacterium]|nr:hypothetical protein [Gaiellaceae bacterium]
MTPGGGQRVEPLALDGPQPEWSALAKESRNVFATPEFLRLWWEVYGGDRQLLLHAVRDPSGRLAAVLPLYLWRRRPLRVLRFLGHGVGDELGPICSEGDREEAARALQGLLQDTGAQLLVGEHLPRPAGWRERLGGRVLVEEGSPILRLTGLSWDELLAARSKNLRSMARRSEKKLLERGARYRLADDPARLDDDLTTLFRLHRERWQKPTGFGSREDFHRRWAPVALERGWLRFWLLELEGRPLAAWYGLRFAGTESYYQSGRDLEFDRDSVGLTLLAHSIRSALEDGMEEYRFLRGDEPYKYRFTQDDPGLETIAVTRGLAGSSAVAAARFGRAARQRLRGALRRA